MILKDKVVVVTGALGTLGAAVAEAAEAAGAKVARLDVAQPKQPSDLVFGGVDLTNEAASGRVMDEIAARLGRIDGLANIAGGFTWQTVRDGQIAAWQAMFKINVLTALTASRAALAHLGKAGPAAIVNVGAGAATKAAAGMGAYAAAKSGVLRLTESLAEELTGAGVRVNAVLPTVIDTPANRRDMPKADFTTWVTPQDIAEVVVFLLSEQASAVNGAAVPVGNPRRGTG